MRECNYQSREVRVCTAQSRECVCALHSLERIIKCFIFWVFSCGNKRCYIPADNCRNHRCVDLKSSFQYRCMKFRIYDLHRLSMNVSSYSRYDEFKFMSTHSLSTLKYITQTNPRVLPEIKHIFCCSNSYAFPIHEQFTA